MYKQKTNPANVTITNSLKDVNPIFEEINYTKNIFNFHIKSNSPCINAALAPSLIVDLDGKPRPIGIRADIGCYEKQ